MKRTLLLLLFALLVCRISAQAPHMFNYQAVARDGSGEILKEQNLTIRVGIFRDGALEWQEDHDVMTNEYGLFTLQIGSPDATNISGAAGSFENIQWGNGNFELKIQVDDGSGFQSMGTGELISVPYALHAANGPVGPQGPEGPQGPQGDPATDDQTLSLTGTTLIISDGNSVDLSPIQDGVNDADANPGNEIQDLTFTSGVLRLSQDPGNTAVNIDSRISNVSGWDLEADTVQTARPVAIFNKNPENEKPLFEVRNDLGNPVFAVYNSGVMVYVDENKKGIKGGFAVGGYNSATKGPTQEYMMITPDSVRFWVPDDSPAKGIKGGFAVGGYNTSNKASTNSYLEINRTNTSVYFDATNTTKGLKGGFAVGGYNSTGKATPAQLMSLDQDNYLIGHSAGLELAGTYNQFFGYESGMLSTTADYNVYIGYRAGQNNVTGDHNVLLGYNAGQNNPSGYQNVLIGYRAGEGGAGYRNVIIGNQAGLATDGTGSVYIGDQAGGNATGGWANVFIGQQAGLNNQTGVGTQGARNVFMGREAGQANTTGGNNTYIGTFAASDNIAGLENVVIGTVAASVGTEGSRNNYMGYRAGYTNNGDYNLVLGHNAGSAESNYTIASDYDYSVMLGAQSGYSTTTGDRNTYIGYQSGRNNQTGAGNVMIGYQAGYSETGSDRLYIDNSSTSTPLIYGDFSADQLTINGGTQANGTLQVNGDIELDGFNFHITADAGTGDAPANYVYQGGQAGSTSKQFAFAINDFLWVTSGAEFDGNILVNSTTYSSDIRYKKNIIPISNALLLVEQMNGVFFDWKKDEYNYKGFDEGRQVGLIAQEVEKVLPEIVNTGEDGYKSVDYAKLSAILLQALKEQQQEIDDLKTKVQEYSSLEDRIQILENGASASTSDTQ